ncbi:MAG: YlxR family protein [Chloroflexi bacterium]|nr:YlxR family protein [Ardenticatenaceae bacterium]MBL1130015.1 YlxR family protein [Chloroflexota bacterium]NOG36101.1 YlxR family protein [Chloroflexota bacterium]
MAKPKQPYRPRHTPQRTCVMCRQKYDKRRLTRLVHTADAGVVVDPTGKRNGRGAYLCDQPTCWDSLSHKPGILAQALKTNITAEELAAIALHKPA